VLAASIDGRVDTSQEHTARQVERDLNMYLEQHPYHAQKSQVQQADGPRSSNIAVMYGGMGPRYRQQQANSPCELCSYHQLQEVNGQSLNTCLYEILVPPELVGLGLVVQNLDALAHEELVILWLDQLNSKLFKLGRFLSAMPPAWMQSQGNE